MNPYGQTYIFDHITMYTFALDVTSNNTMDSSIFVNGETFSSYEILKTRIEKFEEENFIKLWIRDSRTITSAQKRGIKRHLNPDIHYYSLKLSCIHGGKSFKCRGSGSRSTS